MSQLTFQDAALGAALKDQGLAAVSVNADNFLRLMRATARRISDESGFCSTDNLRVIADRLGLVPHHPNAWGAIFTGKHWKEIGRQKSKYPGNHAREIRVWRWEEESCVVEAR